MEIIVLCGGPSFEYEVSLSTTDGILKNIDKKYKVRVLLMSRDYKSLLFKPTGGIKTFPKPKNELADDLGKISKDAVVLIAMHGEFGEDGVVQSLLENIGLKYTGSKVASSILCMDKYASYQALNKVKEIEVPKIYSIEKILSGKWKEFKFPLVIKPNAMGSSVGVEIVDSKKEFDTAMKTLEKELSGVDFIFQKYIGDSIEVSCGCLEKKSGEYIELPPIEIQPQAGKFYDYKSKYQEGGSRHYIPAISIGKTLQDKVSKLACDIHKSLGCSTYSRSDFIIKGKTIYYLETNSLPGMTATSLIPEEAKAIGINYSEFLNFLIENV